MSNPAVIVLSSGKIGKNNVAIEDNVGEAIHLHMDDIRIDFSYSEFKKLAKGTRKVVENIVSVPGFNCDDFDPVYLGSILPYLLDLERIEMDTIYLKDILINHPKVFNHTNFRSLKSSIDYQELVNPSGKINRFNSFNHIGQSGSDRLDTIVKSIKLHGYPYNGKKMVFFNDSNVIRDGQHRAAVLLYLYGNIEVPIIRLYFRNDKYSYKNIQIKHMQSLKNRQYLLGYVRKRMLNIINKKRTHEIHNWCKKNKKLIKIYDTIDK